ncbi:MAG: amino acid transporter substrate-binding protein [Proteobacteria bacterium]|nr:amino acid transporter substrate-binding protein [Pseudomonadota bacterium]
MMRFRWRPRFILILGLLTAGAAAAEPSAVATGPTLSRILARQVLYVGYREAALPFSYLLPGQALPTGYLWEVCSHVFKAVDERLGRSVPVVPVAVTDNARTMMLKTGITDLDCGAAGNTVGRQKQVNFSTNVYVSEIKVMVKQGAGFTSFGQFADKRVVTVVGSTGERHVKLAALGNNLVLQHLLANTPAEAMAMLAKGEVEAYVAEDAILVAQRAATAGDYVLLDSALATEPFGIMLPLGDPLWKKLVDDVLLDLMRRGELAQIYDKWFMGPIPPAGVNLNLPMSDLLKAAIREPGDTPVN